LELPVDHYRKLARLMKHPGLQPDEKPSSTPSGANDITPEPDNDWGLSEHDLGGAGVMPDTRFLGVYSRHGIELALEESGLMGRLRQRGFRALRVTIDLDDPMGHTLRIQSGESDPLVVLEMKLRVNRKMEPGRHFLSVEWLLIQNARSTFKLSRQPLPGQKFPGLGLLRDTVAVLIVVCERMDLDGLIFTPTHFHLARMAQPMACFVDPTHQARLSAMLHAVRGLRLEEAARAVENGMVVDDITGEPVCWAPSPMVVPVAVSLKKYFGSTEYESLVAAASRNFLFRLTPG
jgi:hypothetical protein